MRINAADRFMRVSYFLELSLKHGFGLLSTDPAKLAGKSPEPQPAGRVPVLVEGVDWLPPSSDRSSVNR